MTTGDDRSTILEVDGLTHRYGDELAVEDVSFGLVEGEIVALLGPSGCGKTTIVNAIAGHLAPTGGRIRLRGDDVTDTPPESRRVGIVFQSSTLFPHMTVAENVAYGLREVDPADRDDCVSTYLDLVDLEEQRSAYPAELSGGQERRVELARALAPEPDVLMLDEPLSALDPTLRERLSKEIARIQRETGVTTLFVTHDQAEAMTLADRLLVMTEGELAVVGEPRTLYESPPTPYVATFLGRSNALSATVAGTDPLSMAFDGSGESGTHADPPSQTLRISKQGCEALSRGDTVVCHVRPEHLTLDVYSNPNGDVGESENANAPVDDAVNPTEERPNGLGRVRSESNTVVVDHTRGHASTCSLPGKVTGVLDRGRHYDVSVRLECGDELVVERRREPPAVGTDVRVHLDGADLTVFDTATGD